MQTYKIIFFKEDSDHTPASAWLDVLKDRKGAAIIKARIERLRFGNFGDSEFLGAGVYELRVHYGPGYRLYYMNSNAREEKVIILLCAGDKSTQKKDIQIAKKYALLIKESDHA